MKISTFEYFVREALISLRRNGLMSVASVSTMALSLFILGLFLILVLNLTHLASTLESQVQISVYLQDSLSEHETREIGTRITKLSGVNQVLFVNKDEAMKRFQERLGEQKNLLNALGETNPLPNAFEVKVERPEQVKTVAKAISELKGVENAKFGQEVIEQLFSLTKLVRIFGLVLIILLALAAIFIIANTIRLTVFARRKEIGIMKYVGATDWFIRWPFLFEGILLGFGGAVLAVLILSQTYGLLVQRIYDSLAFLPLLPEYPFIPQLSAFLVFVGMLVGATGSVVSLRRFMKV